MIILDGFSSNYLKKELCPSLFSITSQYFSILEYMFGFQGIGAAIYSGASPNVTGVFTEFILKKNDEVTNPQLFQTLLKLTDAIPDDWLCPVTRHALFRIFGKRQQGISNVIPSHLLECFSPKLTKKFSDENSLGHLPTVFDVLRVNKISYEYQMPAPRSENVLITNIIQRIKRGKLPNLMVIHPCSLDIIGHKFGPHSSQVEQAVKRVDKQVQKISDAIRLSSDKITMIILSDHGMSPVTHQINLLKALDKLPISLRKDFLVFLDSTMARFWFFNDRATKLIVEALSTLNCGQILEKGDLEKLGIDKVGMEYGQLIFALKEGYTIFPDFFRKHSPPKGMHGYAFPSYDAPILLVHIPSLGIVFKRKKVARYIDIMPTVLELLALPIPKTCEGVSLLI